MWSYNSAFQSEQVRLIPIPRYSAYGNVLGHNNKAAIISETKWTLIGRNICFVMSFSSRVQNRPRVGGKERKRKRLQSAHLKCSEPFLETRGWLDWGDTSSLLPLTIGCSDVAKCGGCGRTWDNSRRAVILKGRKQSILKTNADMRPLKTNSVTKLQSK